MILEYVHANLTKDPKQSWHHVNYILAKNYESNNIPQNIIGEAIISDNLMIAEALNYFLRVLNPTFTWIWSCYSRFPEKLISGREWLFTLSEISEYEVIR